MEVSYHLLHTTMTSTTTQTTNGSQSSESGSSRTPNNSNNSDSENQIDTIKRKLIADTCNGVPEKAKILNLHNKQLALQDLPVIESMKAAYSHCSALGSTNKHMARFIPSTPERILDAPDFKNDYCITKKYIYYIILPSYQFSTKN